MPTINQVNLGKTEQGIRVPVAYALNVVLMVPSTKLETWVEDGCGLLRLANDQRLTKLPYIIRVNLPIQFPIHNL